MFVQNIFWYELWIDEFFSRKLLPTQGHDLQLAIGYLHLCSKYRVSQQNLANLSIVKFGTVSKICPIKLILIFDAKICPNFEFALFERDKISILVKNGSSKLIGICFWKTLFRSGSQYSISNQHKKSILGYLTFNFKEFLKWQFMMEHPVPNFKPLTRVYVLCVKMPHIFSTFLSRDHCYLKRKWMVFLVIGVVTNSRGWWCYQFFRKISNPMSSEI